MTTFQRKPKLTTKSTISAYNKIFKQYPFAPFDGFLFTYEYEYPRLIKKKGSKNVTFKQLIAKRLAEGKIYNGDLKKFCGGTDNIVTFHSVPISRNFQATITTFLKS